MPDSPELMFRLAEDRDRTAFIDLARLSFMPMMSLAAAAEDFCDRPLNPPHCQDWVVENAAGSIIGRYSDYQFTVQFAGAQFPMAGVSGVAVGVANRGQGVAQWMLAEGLRRNREQGTLLSMLYPFRHSFYRKLGWAKAGEAHQYRVSSRHLPLFSERSRVIAYQPDHQAAMQQVYHDQAMQRNGWIVRQAWRWQAFFKPQAGRELYVYQHDGAITGYIVLRFVKLEPDKNDHLAVIVQEWVAATAEAYRGLVGFVGSLRDQVTTIVWNTDLLDPFPHLLIEQERDPSLTLPYFHFPYFRLFGFTAGGFMWRLVDPQRAIALRSVQPGPAFELTMQITDPVFGADQFTIAVADGHLQLGDRPARTILKTSVVQLTQLFTGLRRSRQLHWTGELELDGDERILTALDAAWDTPSPFCWDAF